MNRSPTSGGAGGGEDRQAAAKEGIEEPTGFRRSGLTRSFFDVFADQTAGTTDIKLRLCRGVLVS